MTGYALFNATPFQYDSGAEAVAEPRAEGERDAEDLLENPSAEDVGVQLLWGEWSGDGAVSVLDDGFLVVCDVDAVLLDVSGDDDDGDDGDDCDSHFVILRFGLIASGLVALHDELSMLRQALPLEMILRTSFQTD